MTAASWGRRARRTALGLVAARRTPPLPDAVHPVAWFGTAMGRVESVLWRDRYLAGVVHTGIGVGLGLAAGAVTDTTTAVALTTAGTQLRELATEIADHLGAGDLDAARAALPGLVGRDPSALDEAGVAAAVIESVAENMVDAVFAPAWWAFVAGAPGATTYRAVNTMDAMVGRRDERHSRYGWASARLDDLANLIPARQFAVALAAVRPGRAGPLWAAVARDAHRHPSPNAGVAEAAMAGVLGRQLGGPLHYGTTREDRPTLGTGPRPGVADIAEAVACADATERLLIAVLSAVGVGIGVATGTVAT